MIWQEAGVSFLCVHQHRIPEIGFPVFQHSCRCRHSHIAKIPKLQFSQFQNFRHSTIPKFQISTISAFQQNPTFQTFSRYSKSGNGSIPLVPPLDARGRNTKCFAGVGEIYSRKKNMFTLVNFILVNWHLSRCVLAKKFFHPC